MMLETANQSTPTVAVTAEIARFVSGLAFAALPPATVEAAKKLLLDGIGCLLAGTQGGPGKMAWSATDMIGVADGPSTAFIARRRISPRDAAFVNGITLYSVGVNDIHKPAYAHPGGCVVPTVISVGEWLDAPGEEIIAAMVAGYDVMGRLGRALVPGHWDRGFHPTGTFGPFATAASAGRLLRLDPSLMSAALGIAGSQSSGLKAFQSDGSLTMVFHAGRSAQNGVEAAALAKQGFTGPSAVFEDPQGFLRVTNGGDCRVEALYEGLGERYEIDQTSFRPYYGCSLTIGSSGATAEIMRRRKGARPADIARIKVRAHPDVFEDVGDDDPRTLLAARLSLEFNIALVVERGDVVLGDIGEDALWNADLRRLLPLFEFERDPAMSVWSSVITVGWHDGSVETAEVLFPKGDPENPMSWDEVEAKFLAIVAPLGNQPKARALVDVVRQLERQTGRSLAAAIEAALPEAGKT